MKTLTRYLLKDTLKPTILALILMSSIIWLLQSLRFMDYIVNKGLPFLDFLWMTALVMPYMLIVVLPLALFAGTLYAFKKLNDDNEIHSLFAAGLSRWTVVWPSMVMALIVSICCYVISLFLIPYGMSTLKAFQHDLAQGGSNFVIEEHTFTPIGKDLMIFVQERLDDNRIQGIMVHDNSNTASPVTWIAEEGRIFNTAEGMPVLQLIRGSRQEISHSDKVQVLEFQSHTVELLTPKQKEIKRIPRPRELYMGELLQWDDKKPETVQEYKAEFHKRLLWPLTPFAYVLLAAVILVKERRRRSGSVMPASAAALSAFAFQSLIMVGDNLAKKGDIIMLYAQWLLPLGVIVVCSIILSDVFHKDVQEVPHV